MLRHGRLKWKH